MNLFSRGSSSPKGKQVVKTPFVNFFGLKFKYSKAKGLSFEGEIQLYRFLTYSLILVCCAIIVIKVTIIIVNR
jgi:hypothetical protein